MKKNRRWTCAALALALVAPAGRPANAQSSASSRHRALDGMSSADRAVLQARRGDLAAAARIYGYNLAVGNWAFEQAPCAAMPDTLLLRYRQKLPGGAQSLFTAAVPRAAGRVRIVPVLYRNATPFLPAPTNPRNVALFNQLVPQPIARRATRSLGNSVELGVCYAELTGARVHLGSASRPKIGIAGAPAPTIRLQPRSKTSSVTLATRENTSAYKVWSLAFNQHGRVTGVTTDDETVYDAKAAPPLRVAKTQASNQPAKVEAPAAEPGWKFIPPPPDPPSKIIPPAPQPQEMTTPEA